MTVHWTWDLDPGPSRIDPARVRRLRERVDEVLEDQQDAYLAFLQELLRLPTVSGAVDREGQQRYRRSMDACLALGRREAGRLGMEWRDHDGIAAVAEWKGEHGQEDSLGIAAHLDVVPPEGQWSHDPFGAEQIDGELWGRGTQDDKGPAAMAFAAVDVLQRLGLQPRGDLRLFFGTLEETDDWPDIDLLLERERAPELTLVPDGAFPVIVGEKGIITVEWRAHWPPGDDRGLRFIGLHSGDRHNVVPAEARLWFACPEHDVEGATTALQSLPAAQEVRKAADPPPAVGDDACLELLFEGKAAHGAFPQDGDNAALKALEALHGRLGDTHAGLFARFLLDTCSGLDGAGLDLDRSHTRMGDSTLNLGVVEMGPGQGHALVNVRFPLGLKIPDVEERFHAAADAAPEGLQITSMTRGRPQDPMFVSPEDHPRMIHTLQAAYEVGTGREPRLASIAGTTYAKAFPLAVAFGPQDQSAGEPILAHQRDERVTVERHMENIRVYVLALALLGCDAADIDAACEAGPRRSGQTRASASSAA